MYAKAVHAALALTGMFALAGCVWPGEVDPSAIGRYQRAMLGRSPQKRAGAQGTGLVEPVSPALGPALQVTRDATTGKAQVQVSLNDAIVRALANSQDIQVVSFDPAIAREELIQAAAEFDYILFGAINYDETNKNVNSLFAANKTQTNVYQAGIKKKTITGAQAALTWTWTRTWDNSTGSYGYLSVRHEPMLNLEFAQPLLRDAGLEVNLAKFRIACLNEKLTSAQFRQKVEEALTEVISTYWLLVQSRRDLKIQEELLDNTRETQRRVVARKDLDATDVQIKQSEAAVEARRAGVIRARKVIQDAQDRLARLMADKQVNLLDNMEIIPATEPITDPVRIDPTDQLVAALARNPILEQARLGIQAADITVRVADNQTLPRLDLRASAGLQGLSGGEHGAINDFNTGNWVSYAVGLSLEYPLGNRAALAELSKRRFERLKAITTMQNVADQVAVAIKERIRQIETTHEEMKAQHAAVAAARVQLKALEDTEAIRGRLTPEFLQVKLQAQETLAVAERSELEAIVQYNVAMVELARAAGTVLDIHGVQISLPRVTGDGDLAGAKAQQVRPPAPPVKPPGKS